MEAELTMRALSTITAGVDRSIMDMIVFPIIKVLYYPDETEVHRLVGTGFFFDSDRIFLSARHVFQGRESALDREDAREFALYCVHAVNLERKMVARHIDVESIRTRHDTDIATGRVLTKQFGAGDVLITEEELTHTAHFNYASAEHVPVGTRIWTVAHHLTTVSRPADGSVNINSTSEFFGGTVREHHPEQRDSVMLPWPCYRTDMNSRGGASGGPVFISGSSGVVFAINCTGWSGDAMSYVTSLAPLTRK